MTARLEGDLMEALSDLLRELTQGPPGKNAYVLNQGDPGLLGSLRSLNASEASAVPREGGASVAAHVDHVRYGLELLNRWSDGENPFADADWGASWRRGAVTDEEWRALLSELEREITHWSTNIRQPRDLDQIALRGVVASLIHLAYHLGAIRQVNRKTKGPPETG